MAWEEDQLSSVSGEELGGGEDVLKPRSGCVGALEAVLRSCIFILLQWDIFRSEHINLYFTIIPLVWRMDRGEEKVEKKGRLGIY